MAACASFCVPGHWRRWRRPCWKCADRPGAALHIIRLNVRNKTVRSRSPPMVDMALSTRCCPWAKPVADFETGGSCHSRRLGGLTTGRLTEDAGQSPNVSRKSRLGPILELHLNGFDAAHVPCPMGPTAHVLSAQRSAWPAAGTRATSRSGSGLRCRISPGKVALTCCWPRRPTR